jgi:hypothetical protein
MITAHRMNGYAPLIYITRLCNHFSVCRSCEINNDSKHSHTYILERGVGLMEEVREARRQDEVVLGEVEEEGGANQQRQIPRVRGDRVHARFEDLADHLGQHRGNQDLPFVQVGQADGVLLPVSGSKEQTNMSLTYRREASLSVCLTLQLRKPL